jgi:hypothetical protein
MQTFKLERDGLGKKILLRSLPSILVILIVVTVMDVINGDFINLSRPVTYIPQLVFFPCLIGFSLWWGIKKQKKLMESYELTISDKLICREQLNTPDISILVTEVVEIVKHPKGGFTIKGSRNNGTIIIPVHIEHYDELEAVLQQIHPIATKSNLVYLQKLRPLIGILGGGLMICVYTVNNKAVVGIAGSLATALMVWRLVRTQKDKNIDRNTKNRAWITLLVIASIVVSTILKLIA